MGEAGKAERGGEEEEEEEEEGCVIKANDEYGTIAFGQVCNVKSTS
jgi:hypothetical protein